ncbi:MAG: hypothetical protein IK999_02835 [Ruminococcus sp.]|nr:hypothetical protein [Ruminococcus sp.]
MELKELLINELNKRPDLTKSFKERVLIEDKISDEVMDQPDIQMSREVVIDYLIKSGYELTDENYSRAEQMLISMEQDKLKMTLHNADKMPSDNKYEIIDHLQDLSLDELNALLNIALLNSLNDITINTKVPLRYDYKVEKIKDIMGGTNVIKFRQVLDDYSGRGYRVKSIFTNELGKNALSVGNVGVNSTVDEVIVVFEKPIFDK